MKQKQKTILALVCGVLCAICVLAFMQSVKGSADAERAEALARYGGEQVEVCVAARDIAAGERVVASALTTKLWVSDLLPSGAFVSADDVVGNTTSSPIFAGEVIVQKRFEKDDVTLDVPEGLAAVSVPAKAVQAVGGAIVVGMRVDIYSSGDTATTAIVRDALVIDTSLHNASDTTSAELAWITIAIDPGLVQQVVAAVNTTDLYFTLPTEAARETAKTDNAEPEKNN